MSAIESKEAVSAKPELSMLVRRLREPPFGTETSERNLMASAADRIGALEVALVEAQTNDEVSREFLAHTDKTNARYLKVLKEIAASDGGRSGDLARVALKPSHD